VAAPGSKSSRFERPQRRLALPARRQFRLTLPWGETRFWVVEEQWTT
jgi:hypothetical protein